MFPQDWLVSGRQPRDTTVKTSVRKITSKTWKLLSLKFLFMKIGNALPSKSLTSLIYCFSAENYPKMFSDISWWKPNLLKVEGNVKSHYTCEFLSQTWQPFKSWSWPDSFCADKKQAEELVWPIVLAGAAISAVVQELWTSNQVATWMFTLTLPLTKSVSLVKLLTYWVSQSPNLLKLGVDNRLTFTSCKIYSK